MMVDMKTELCTLW